MTIEDQIKNIFEAADGSIDVLYTTSDNHIAMSAIEAISHIRQENLKDETITPWFKDATEVKLREVVVEDSPLQVFVALADFVKRARFMKSPEPLYQEYLDFCTLIHRKPAKENAFDFAVERVYNFMNKVPLPGTEIPILLQQQDIVIGTVVKTYGQHKLVLFLDYLILVCPTNMELRAYSIYEMFKPILPNPNKPQQNESVPS